MHTPDFIIDFRHQFPFFNNQLNSPISQAYLDNAATTHICQPALDSIADYYQYHHANVHRSSHQLALGTSNQFESIRQKTADWLNAAEKDEIVWTKGATEAANLIANGLCESHLQAGDEIIIALSEHHAHFVTWQQLAKKYQLELTIAKLDEQLRIDLQALHTQISDKTRVIALAHVNNATGVKQPVEEIIELATNNNIITIIDGSQAINHMPINVQQLACDFYFFSAHKMYAGTGLGVCYGKKSRLIALPPYQYGGEMVKQVSLTESEFNQLPYKFEAGTPNISGVFALGATLDFLANQNLNKLRAYEHKLTEYLIEQLKKRSAISLLATEQLTGAVSFIIKDFHSADAAELLSQMGIAIRSGSHCAMPLIQSIAPGGSLRVSIAAYTLIEEIDYFLSCLDQLDDFL
mgnify:CR=1 FL=1